MSEGLVSRAGRTLSNATSAEWLPGERGRLDSILLDLANHIECLARGRPLPQPLGPGLAVELPPPPSEEEPPLVRPSREALEARVRDLLESMSSKQQEIEKLEKELVRVREREARVMMTIEVLRQRLREIGTFAGSAAELEP